MGDRNTNPKTLLRAAWLAPMDGPPVRDGAVVFAGDRTAAVGPARGLESQFPDALVHDCGEAVILPGLVNAHAHLELSHLSPGAPPRDPADWLIGVIRAAPPPGPEGDRLARDAVTTGAEQCLRFGVTTVGDIAARPAVVRAALAGTPLRGVSYGEVRAMASRRALLEERIAAAATDPAGIGGRFHVGLSPHAPYSVEPQGYRRCLQVARERGLPLTTHLAEFAEEAPFLADHAGPLRRIWDFLGAWDDQVPRFAGGPIQLAEAVGLLDDPRVLLAHVNYCDDVELDRLARGSASVVYCPRTHAHFGHPPHRWREMLARGINVAVGTDSCASSPDLNLVDDLRHLRQLAPDLPALTLWELATNRAARAIGRSRDVGTLEPGKYADAVAFPASASADPLADVLDRQVLPREVWIGGRMVR